MLLLIFQQLGHQVVVVARIFVVGLRREHALVGGQRLVEAAALGQGVAQVVLRARVIQRAQAFDGRLQITAAIGRRPAPGGILKFCRRLGVFTRRKRRGGLLIRAREPIRQRGVDRGGGRGQQHETPSERARPASPKGQKRNQQGEPNQNDPGIAPGIRLETALAQGGKIRRLGGAEREQRLDITLVGPDRGKAAAPGLGNSTQSLGLGMQAQNRNRVARCGRSPGRLLGPGRILTGTVGEHHDTPSTGPGIFQQLPGLGDAPVETAPASWHQAAVQGGDHLGDDPGVVREGRHRVGLLGEDHQSDTALGPVEQVLKLVARPFQAAGCRIPGVHGRRELKHRHGLGGLGIRDLGQALPGGAGQRNDGHEPPQHARCGKPMAVLAALAVHQMSEEFGVANLPPFTRRARRTAEPKPGQRQQGQGPEPLGAEKMKTRVQHVETLLAPISSPLGRNASNRARSPLPNPRSRAADKASRARAPAKKAPSGQ